MALSQDPDAQRFRLLQDRALELAITEGDLHAILDELMLEVERQSPGQVLGSILLLDDDGARLRHGGAPSLPKAYNEAIDGIAIGSGVGSCGTAAAEERPVYVSDIANDPLWVDFRELALAHGLRACWSTPFVDNDGRVLGTFAMYYREPREPLPADLEVVALITRFASLIVCRDRATKALKASERRLRELNETLERRVEQAVAERQIFADVVEQSPASVTVLDRDGVILAINRANIDEFEKAFGLRPQVGDDFFALTEHLPEQHDLMRRLWTRALDGERFTATHAFGDADLGQHHYEVRFEVLRDRDGNKLGAISTSNDVTDRIRAQDALVQAQEELRQSQKMEAMGQLTGGVAHDFNNLLTVIRGSIDLLRRPDVPAERRGRYLDAIADTADRAIKLTSQLLAFARRQALKPEVFDVARSIADLQDMLRTLTGSRIQVVTEAEDCPCPVDADRSQFDTAIVNMAVNARDAMNGVGTLTISVGHADGMPTVRAHPCVPGNFVRIALTDTGSGIAQDQIDRIFEPFFTTKGVGEGTGLGLSQVFGFAKQSGGDVLVESVVSQGSTFTLYLPRANGDRIEASERAAAESPGIGEGACILVVEDNPDVSEFATQALGELGYHTVLAADATAALTELASSARRFDVVFSDIVMPGMSGVELAQEIGRLHPHLPVVLTSGYNAVMAQGGTQGFELLHKPYSIDELSRVLRKVANWRATAGNDGEANS